MDDAARFESLRRALRQEDRGLYFAPIRHHSPACAWALRELIREIRPRSILIEAPVDLQQHISTLLDKETRPPVAVAVLVDRKEQSRLAAYYPFCAHSPEYIALVEGRMIRSEIKFIDLPSADKAMLARPSPEESIAVDDEEYFDSGDFVSAMCQQLGCRNGFELWDHLFESKLGTDDWGSFFGDVGAYCAALRDSTSTSVMTANGDIGRERHMAALLKQALRRKGPIVVVAGGFHIPALVDAANDDEEVPVSTSKDTASSYLIRYGFAALDALSGYAAGLPQPGYYDYLWQQANQAAGEPQWRETALDLMSRFGRQLRDKGHIVSVPAQVEVIRAAECLAMMRGRKGAGRYDLIDAVRTALVKGETGAREVWTERLLEFLRGDAIGDVPASAGSPPLVEDARERARKLRIDVSDGARRRRRLDIRRKPAHLAASRFFHAMTLLESGFAERQAGPDFLHGVHTDRLFEEWSYAWSPQVEGRLIELAAQGDSVPGACIGFLSKKRSEMQIAGQSRDIVGMAGLFVQGILAGLDHELAPLLRDLSSDIQAHGDFDSVARSLRRLHHIAQASGPLGVPDQLDLNGVRQAAYRRLVYLCDDLPRTSQDAVQGRIEALRLVVELLRAPGSDDFDHSLFDDAIDRVANGKPPPEILGSVLAICVQAGRRDPQDICTALSGSFSGTVDRQEDRIGVLRGLLFTTPEILWRSDTVLAETDRLVCGLSDDEFIELLPHIRLAFTALNPRESDRISGLLARIHGGHVTDFMGRNFELSDRDLARGVQIERALRDSVKADGLESWLEEEQ